MTTQLYCKGGKYCGREYLDYGIKPGDRVLDVGGAVHTFGPATHVIDFGNEHKGERYGRNAQVGGRTFMQGDVCEILPTVADDYFDFCYSAHTFEHIENLPEALRLISAKCKRGYYAVPATCFEFLMARDEWQHKWLMRLDKDGVLWCARRPSFMVIDRFGQHWTRLWNNREFRALWEGTNCRGYRFLWERRHMWRGNIPYKVCYPEDIYPQVVHFEEFAAYAAKRKPL